MPSKPGISTSKKTISFWDLSERRLSPSLKVTISRLFTFFLLKYVLIIRDSDCVIDESSSQISIFIEDLL